jgi:predicted Zn-ribbon and HTH transcriptional regulator
MARKTETPVPERGATQRAAVREALLGRALTAREISVRTSIREKDVADHLGHLDRSLRRQGERLIVVPARCLSCEFEIGGRGRFTTPGRCPQCRSERVAPPAFRVEGASEG